MSKMSRSLLQTLLGAALALTDSIVLAADEAVNKAPPMAQDNLAGNLLQTTLGLLLILLLIGASAWAMKRFGNIKMGAQGRLKVVGGISLGTRERVILLEVGDQQLLLGVAPGRISTLHVLEEPLPVHDTTQRAGGGFAERLQAVLKGENPNQRSGS